jgi:tRNA dimethylallyltransferase
MDAGQPARVIVIAGPTATGKTALAVEICERVGGEIIGADSVQVYRGFDIGSAKPSAQSLRGVRHHMLDLRDPSEPMDAAEFARIAAGAIDDTVSREAVPVVAGGTGLWIRALLRGLVDAPRVDVEIRTRLEREWDTLGSAAMHRRLSQVDARSAARIHPNDKLRVVRALEVYEQTAIPMGELHERHALGSPRYRALTFHVDIPDAHLRQRLRERTREMIEGGWAEEVRELIGKHGPDVRPLDSVGYRQMKAHVIDGIALDVTEEQVVRATRLYAKRQRTWFKGDPDFGPSTTPDEVLGNAGRALVDGHLAG